MMTERRLAYPVETCNRRDVKSDKSQSICILEDSLSCEVSLQVACGFDFSVLLAADGSLYAFGDNSLGQLGRDTGVSNSDDLEDWLLKDSNGSAYCIDLVSSCINKDPASYQQRPCGNSLQDV